MVFFVFSTMLSHAQQANTKITPVVPLVADGLGRGVVALNGPCQFHLGDDQSWAAPAFDDSGWERLATDQPWGQQGHPRYTGFAWYRCSIALTPAPGASPQFSILLPLVDDAYEVYWNGSLIGGLGKLQPRPVCNGSHPLPDSRSPSTSATADNMRSS